MNSHKDNFFQNVLVDGSLDSRPGQGFNFSMNATLSSDGKLVLSPELRDTAQLKPGDVLEAQFHKGTIVLRKPQPLTPEQCTALLERSRSRPEPSPEDDAAVEETIREVRARGR